MKITYNVDEYDVGYHGETKAGSVSFDDVGSAIAYHQVVDKDSEASWKIYSITVTYSGEDK